MHTIHGLEEKIGYYFKNRELLKAAITHSSVKNEIKDKNLKNNERLEFLGDAVLELASSKCLFLKYPDMSEGKLTKLRASIVCEQTLASCARNLGLGDFLILSKGEENTGGRHRDSIISDAMEAVIGAIYLDGGFENADNFINQFILNDIEHKQLFHDSKTLLQEIVQKDYPGKDLTYELIRESGPDHDKLFNVQVEMESQVLGEGEGKTKKAAEQQAAYNALIKLQNFL